MVTFSSHHHPCLAVYVDGKHVGSIIPFGNKFMVTEFRNGVASYPMIPDANSMVEAIVWSLNYWGENTKGELKCRD